MSTSFISHAFDLRGYEHVHQQCVGIGWDGVKDILKRHHEPDF